MRPLVFIVPGHGQLSRTDYDPGAVANGLQEAPSVRLLAEQLRQVLVARGVEALVDADGYYSQRHARLLRLLQQEPRVCAVIHLHHNAAAPTARHALAMYDQRSRWGGALAAELVPFLAALAPFGSCQPTAVYDDKPTAGRKAWLHRAYGCIDEVWDLPVGTSACLVEAGFVTNPATARWFLSGEGYAPTAVAIAEGVLRWLAKRAAALRSAA